MEKQKNYNWLFVTIIVLLLGVIGYLLIKDAAHTTMVERELKMRNDSIRSLQKQYRELERQKVVAEELVTAYAAELSIYQDSLRNSTLEYDKLKESHAEQVANLISIPTDKQYRELTRWLDSLSFQ